MHLVLVILLMTATCSVDSSIPIQVQPLRRPTFNDFLINLDEPLSRCGQHRIDIRDLTIPQIQEHFQSGTLTSTELTECYLNRIAKIDVHLKSVIEVNPETISLAYKADRERNENSNRTAIHGIPVLIKDNIGTADCMQTTAGAAALENVKPKRDADVVHRLRKAGAIILGKTNPSEWALDEAAPSGWSGRGGQTLSAFVVDASPSGASTGSAVSISVNLASVSPGTETDGSIISPSSRNALVGVKTTIGRVSTEGVGPMARSVTDAAILLAEISDFDLYGEEEEEELYGCDVDVTTCLPNKNLTIGVIRDDITDPEIMKSLPILEACMNKLNTSGLVAVIDPVTSPIPTPVIKDENVDVVFSHEFKFSLSKYLKDDVEHCEIASGRNISTLADIIYYNELHSNHLNQSLLKLSEQTDGLLNRTYLNAREDNRRQATVYLESLFQKFEVDVLAAPCHQIEFQDLYTFGAYAGFPSITVPVGVVDIGLPFGICLLGKMDSEPVLLKLGHFIELSRSTQRPTPRFTRAHH